MSEQVAKTRVEVFSAPCLFDDTFYKNWVPGGAATFVTDGDIAELKCSGSGDYNADYTFAAAKNTNPNRYLTVRATALTGAHWHVNIYSGETLKVTKTYTDVGVKEIDLYTEFGSHFSYNKVRLEVNGGDSTKYVRFDYIVIGDAAMLVPTTTSDIIDTLEVTRPILSRGIAGLKAKIFNPDGVLTGKVAEHDVILAYLWRDGDAQKKVFGGRIVAPGSDASLDRNEYYVTVNAHDHGWELQKPASLVDAVYAATNGRTIIQAAVDKCVYLSKKFVDVDSDIVSTHDVEFSEITPGRAINEMSGCVVDSGGNVGVDGYVDVAGNVNVFKRGKYNSAVDPLILLGYKLVVDTDRIINKQRVYGEASKPYPASADLCEDMTEDPNNGHIDITEGVWSAVSGNSHVYIETTEKFLGSQSVRAQLEAAGPLLIVQFDFNAGYEPDCSYPPLHRYGKISLRIKFNDVWQDTFKITLIDDAGVHRDCPICKIDVDKDGVRSWTPVSILLGFKDGSKYSPWPGEGAFNWAKIDKVQIRAWTAALTATGSVYIDGLHFSGRRFEGEYESTTSQGLYGTRMAEPIVDDALKSDAECLKRATGTVQFCKDPVKTISGVRVAGDNRFLPGHLQPLVSAVDNINSSFRTIEVKHRVRGTYWETELILNDEPQELAYLLGTLFSKIRSVGGGQARVGSTSVVGGGGGGLGLGEVLEANISAGAVALSKIGDTALARMFASGAVKTAIEAWRHGADLTLIDGGDIYTNTVVVSKLGSDALARLFASSDIKTAIEAWRHSGDLTLIDGGDIYTGSVSLAKLNFVPLTSAGTTAQIVATINASPEGIKIDADNIKIAGTTEFTAGYDPTTKVAGTGGTYQSAASGARVLIFPDANTAIRIIDDAAADVFKALVGGTDVGDVIIGNYAGNKGLKWDKSLGTFTVRGTLVADDIISGTVPVGVNINRTSGGTLPPLTYIGEYSGTLTVSAYGAAGVDVVNLDANSEYSIGCKLGIASGSTIAYCYFFFNFTINSTDVICQIGAPVSDWIETASYPWGGNMVLPTGASGNKIRLWIKNTNADERTWQYRVRVYKKGSHTHAVN